MGKGRTESRCLQGMGTSAPALSWSHLGVQREQGEEEAHAWDVEQGAA